ncbi:MAG: hypothetical protein ACRBBS_07320 [Thalassovita sp.]
MKKFTIAAAAALALASAAPAVADTATNDDPFVSTQASLAVGESSALAAVGAAILIIGIAAAGDS